MLGENKEEKSKAKIGRISYDGEIRQDKVLFQRGTFPTRPATDRLRNHSQPLYHDPSAMAGIFQEISNRFLMYMQQVRVK